MDENSPLPQWEGDVQEPVSEANSGLPEIPPVSWSASEFISHQKSSSWYVVFGVAAAIGTFLVILITGTFISGLVVAMASVALAVFAARKPETKQYEINDVGVTIDGRTFPYEQFKSFSVVEEGAVNSVWLRPLRRFLPTMVMYFSPEDEDRIVDTLENFLPEEARALDTIDRFSRRMRF